MPIAAVCKSTHAFGPWLRLSYVQSLFVFLFLFVFTTSDTSILCLLNRIVVSISVGSISRRRFHLSGKRRDCDSTSTLLRL